MITITLSNLKDKTPQEVFDRVATHLITQGAPARVGGACQYRAPGGNKCAVGCLIADSEYVSDMEEKQVDDLMCFLDETDAPITWTEGLESHYMLLTDLQNMHDDPNSTDGTDDGTFNKAWLLGELRRVGRQHELSVEVLR